MPVYVCLLTQHLIVLSQHPYYNGSSGAVFLTRGSVYLVLSVLQTLCLIVNLRYMGVLYSAEAV